MSVIAGSLNIEDEIKKLKTIVGEEIKHLRE
jgi:hypothetical protein